MESAVCSDGRARGMFQFYGANRTGRWAGRIIQMQNLPQNHLEDLEAARALVRTGNYEAVKMLYSDVPDTLSQLIRTAFIPKDGCKFIVSDFSAIEARVLSHLAGETWRMEVFVQDGDIYCASASHMFKVPVEKHGRNAHLRQKGKIAELALGYGGSVGALKAMGALDLGLSEDELKPLVNAWRQSNPNIVKLWWDVDKAMKQAVKDKTTTNTHGIKFSYESGFLFITLPSGRRLAYVKPRIGTNDFGSDCVTYEGVGATKKWERIETYGPKGVENIIQGISRDLLCYVMENLSDCRIVMSIHDEIVIEASQGIVVEDVCHRMSTNPPWAEGLILNAAGYEAPFYMKD
ncbi:MAG: DNA polymerase, partial [Sphaerochaeta sp.]